MFASATCNPVCNSLTFVVVELREYTVRRDKPVGGEEVFTDL